MHACSKKEKSPYFVKGVSWLAQLTDMCGRRGPSVTHSLTEKKVPFLTPHRTPFLLFLVRIFQHPFAAISPICRSLAPFCIFEKEGEEKEAGCEKEGHFGKKEKKKKTKRGI